MALTIRNPETEAMVRKLARLRHTTLTGAVRLAVINELARDDLGAEGASTIKVAIT